MPIAFDPLAAGFVESPYEQYAELRAADPVHRSELLSGWVLTRYADVDRVLRDGDVSVEPANAAGNPAIDAEIERMERGGRSAATLVLRDDPDHARLRRLMQAPFGPRAVERMRATITERVGELLDELVGTSGPGRSGRLDVVADFAYPLPVALFCELLGVPGEDSPKFRTWTQSVAQNLDPFLEQRGARGQPRPLRRDERLPCPTWSRPSGARPADDVMSALVAAEEDGERLTREELVAQVVTLYVAGHEPVTALVGNGLLALMRHPDELSRLQADPSLLPHAVLELLRYDGPNQFVRRIATQPIEFDEATIEPGEVIYPGVGAANRDPARWGDDAEVLRIDRPDAGSHLQFGAGIHNCLGAHLARLQAEVMLGALLARLTDLELAGDVAWSPRMVLRAVDRLPVQLHHPLTRRRSSGPVERLADKPHPSGRDGCGTTAWAGSIGRQRKSRLFVGTPRSSGSRCSARMLMTSLLAFQDAADHQGRGAGGDPAEPRPAALGDDDVDEAGLVLEVHERDALGGGRALAVGDHAADDHLGAVGHRAQRLGGQHAAAGELVAPEAGGVPVG